ncbi:hypothetical protein [Streptomyces herbicida]|uniref:hypothetical protein n=1 Tax=Streptomyces herbicida TaxID=3065675 RepID=UPI00293071DE|nr:hypothetical protein [Streptomyces sp. NEAU-HV9]
MADGGGPALSGSPSAAVRLEYHVPGGRLLAAGESLWFSIEGMAPGWDRVKVASPALQKPIFLAPVKKGARESMELDEVAEPRIRPGLRAGTYPVTATSHGRTVATASLQVAAQDGAEVYRFVIGPTDAFPGSDTSAPVRPGSDVRVVLTDLRPASEDSLTVRSPIFSGPVTIETDSADDPGCKCDDGGTVYAGHARVRESVPEGRYTLTVVSHHGRQTTKQHVTVAGTPVDLGPSWMVTGAVAAGGTALAAGRVIAVRRRSRTTASSG